MTVTEDHVHNWGIPGVEREWADAPKVVRKAIADACNRHHQKMQDAREEARKLNEQMPLLLRVARLREALEFCLEANDDDELRDHVLEVLAEDMEGTP